MIIIIGLGNPGKKYQDTPHNIGFEVVDTFAEENNFPAFKSSKKFSAEISEAVLDNEKVLLVKPQTFMNNSGNTARSLIDFYKTPTSSLMVVHDDIDLVQGRIKIIKNVSSAGHKGIESIINKTGKEFWRFRVGIQPTSSKPKDAERFVLKKFSSKEKRTMNEVIKKTIEALKTTIEKSPEMAMNKYN